MAGEKVRRLVTGHDADGRSMFVMDGDAPSVLVMEKMGDLTVTDLWETYGSPASNEGEQDNADRAVHLEPGPNGTIFRIVEFPPDSAWKSDEASGAEAFSALQASHVADSGSSDPGMHKTNTVDYALVLAGEIWAVMDSDERLMKAGDVLIQRGTNHAWANRTEENCRVMFVLCDAHPV